MNYVLTNHKLTTFATLYDFVLCIALTIQFLFGLDATHLQVFVYVRLSGQTSQLVIFGLFYFKRI